MRGHEAAGERPCARDGDLLAEDRARDELRRVHVPRTAQARPPCDEPGEEPIRREVCVDDGRVGVEVEQVAAGRHRLAEVVRVDVEPCLHAALAGP